MSNYSQQVTTNALPAPLPIINPITEEDDIVFSQAVKADGFVFVSGNIGLDKETWRMVDGGIVAETKQTLENIKAVLEAAGSSLEKVVKINVCVTAAELPFKALVEMECPALCD